MAFQVSHESQSITGLEPCWVKLPRRQEITAMILCCLEGGTCMKSVFILVLRLFTQGTVKGGGKDGGNQSGVHGDWRGHLGLDGGSEILQPWPSVPFYVCIFFHFNVHDMHVCVYVCLHVCETYMCGCVVTGMNSEAQGWCWELFSVVLFICWGRVSQSHPELADMATLHSPLTVEIPVSNFLGWNDRQVTMPIWLLLGSEDLNVAPYVCVESALTVEVLPYSGLWFLPAFHSWSKQIKTVNMELILLL